MIHAKSFTPETLLKDLIAGLVVFLVALPLCLGIAKASGVSEIAGLLAGIIGGTVVAVVSKSATSVSGPAAGLVAIVLAQLEATGSFRAFLLALFIAGIMQALLGIFKAGFIAAFFPSSVIRGLLAAIGIILILKQLPHLLGHDKDYEGDFSFIQPDHENTFSELLAVLRDYHPGAMAVGVASLLLLMAWDRISFLKKSLIPAPFVVVALGVLGQSVFLTWGQDWNIAGEHLVQVPVSASLGEFARAFVTPDFSQWLNPAIYLAAFTICVVASLETLLNLEAVDKLDPKKRHSPPNRELVAQGLGNMTAGLIGGIPVTSVIVRSSVNILAGGQTRLSAVVHGVLLFVSVVYFPQILNKIPLSTLAAILILTGFKLASFKLFKQMWKEGSEQFLPFVTTVVAIVFTDLLIGILIGLGVAIAFILRSNYRRPLRRVHETHLAGDLLRIELANQVSFLNRAVIMRTLEEVPDGGHVLLDARYTDYIDPDVLALIQDFKNVEGPARDIRVSLVGFKESYHLPDDLVQDVDYSSRELQQKITPKQVIDILRQGNERFRAGQRLVRDLSREVDKSAAGQFPLAVVLTCIDSRAPAEMIFDLGVGDIFVVRIAGNVAREKVLGSMEYACAVAGSKLILVMGHTRCGAVTSSIQLLKTRKTALEATGCENLDKLVTEIQKSIDPKTLPDGADVPTAYVDLVARTNVLRTVASIKAHSRVLDRLAREGQIAIIGGMYDISTGHMEFLPETLPAETPTSNPVIA